MSIRNKIVKALGYVGIVLLTMVSSYVIAFVGMCFPASLICAVWSFIKPLPDYIARNFGILLLQSSVPVGIFITLYVLKYALKK